MFAQVAYFHGALFLTRYLLHFIRFLKFFIFFKKKLKKMLNIPLILPFIFLFYKIDIFTEFLMSAAKKNEKQVTNQFTGFSPKKHLYKQKTVLSNKQPIFKVGNLYIKKT